MICEHERQSHSIHWSIFLNVILLFFLYSLAEKQYLMKSYGIYFAANFFVFVIGVALKQFVNLSCFVMYLCCCGKKNQIRTEYVYRQLELMGFMCDI